jgi:hypothetical protein
VRLRSFVYYFLSLGKNVRSRPISSCFLCAFVCNPPKIIRQRLGNHVPMGRNTLATVEELFDASFSMQCFSYQRNVGD